MAYERTTWVSLDKDGNVPAGAPSINATRLNNMENGIEEALGKITIGEVVHDGSLYQNVHLNFAPTCVLGADKSGKNKFFTTISSENDLCKITEDGFLLCFAIDVDGSNIGQYFNTTIADTGYFFEWSSSNKAFMANNKKSITKTATTELTALYDITITFNYGYVSEASCDKYHIKHNDVYILNGVSGSGSGTITRTLKKGDKLTFSFSKDANGYPNDEKCYFSNLHIHGLEGGSVSYMVIK